MAHDFRGQSGYPTALTTPRNTYTLDDYQRDASRTAIYPGNGSGSERALIYLILKLAGEAGECAQHVGKYLRGDYDWPTLIAILRKELGDVSWYTAMASGEIGSKFSDIAIDNILKLSDRESRGVLHGDGDDR
jgi:NTP pyrophosphatase (non-canonical NTP hydrolase)